MRDLTHTKIVATLGPASGGPDTVRELVEAGVDVFRLNMSHGTHEEHARYVAAVRRAAADAGLHVAVMIDLQGPRIRTGRLRGGRPVELERGAEVTLRPGEFEGDAGTVAVTYRRLAEDVRPGDAILISDGLIELDVTAVEGADVRCRVRAGGRLGEHKGLNLPGVELGISAPTRKDLADLRFGIEQGADYVALSFVCRAKDLLRLKEEAAAMASDGQPPPVIAKIERPQAVENLDEILLASDGVMVARGDLGIEMPPELVPAAQKKIIAAANRLAVPVITATQMLESMVNSPRPTRAEASDVANAILDGTDAVMLSGETSIGRYPVEAVRMMARIAQQAERMRRQGKSSAPPEPVERGNARQLVLAEAACFVADRLGAAGIVPFTLTGSTARWVSQRRPAAPVYALTPQERTCRRLALLWGVQPVMLEMFQSTDQMIQNGQRRLLQLGLASPGQTMVCIAGASTNTPGGTDMLKLCHF